MPEPRIVAIGGVSDDALLDYVLGIAPGRRLLYVPTASNEDPARTVWWYERLRGRAEMTPLQFFPWPPSDLRELVLRQDIVLVPGGNTANAIAIWRTHGFDEILREAWESGTLLTGWSAGMICWFEHGLTDSFGPELAPMECLGFRTTTERRDGGLCTGVSSPKDSLRESPRTTTSVCATTERSSRRS
jgi:dipeptidase E